MEVASRSESYRTPLIVEYDEGLQRTPELERRQQSSMACRLLQEVQYHTMSSITAVQQQQKSKYHPITHRVCTIVQQYSRVEHKSLSTNNPRSHHVCTIKVQQ